jgi:hypothetical protein
VLALFERIQKRDGHRENRKEKKCETGKPKSHKVVVVGGDIKSQASRSPTV